MAGKKIRGITIELGADTSKFQKEMNAVDKSLNSTQRELKDVDKLLKFDPKNTTLLAQKQDLLKKSIDDTDDKLKKEREALEKLKKADKSPEVEKQMRALERQIVDDEHKLDSFNKELKETGKASSGVEKAKERFAKFGKGLGTAGKVVGGVAAVGAATAAGIVKAGEMAGKAVASLASDSAKAGDEIDKMSQKVGMSRKGYQEWSFVLSQNGADIKSLQGGMKTLSKNISMGSDKSVDALNALGLSMEQLQGMDREAQFETVITALQGMEDSSERAAVASQLLGRAGTGLNPLLNQSAEATQNLRDKANELGMVMGDDAVDAAVDFQDQLDGLKRTFETTKNGVSSQMLPALTEVMGGLQMLMIGDNGGAEQIEKGFNDLFTNIGDIVDKFGNIIETIFSSLMMVLPNVISKFIGLLTKILIQNLPTIITAIQQMVQAVLNAVAQNSAQFSKAITQFVLMIVDLIVNNFPLLLQVGIDVILALATGIAQAIPQLVPQIVELVMRVCDVILENLPLIIDAGIAILIGLMDGIIKALPTLIKYIPTLIGKVLVAIGKIIPKLAKLAKTMFSKLTQPFRNIGKWFGNKFGGAWKKIKEKFSGVGKFFGGIWDTIKTKFSEVGTKIGNAIGGTFKKVMNSVFATVENAINAVPNLINKALGALNKILPKDKQLGTLGTVTLPRLAKGGMTTAPTTAIIGDNPSHNEAVLPLNDPRTVELFRKALNGVGGGTVNQTINVGQMSSYKEAYMIRRATEQGLKKLMRATV